MCVSEHITNVTFFSNVPFRNVGEFEITFKFCIFGLLFETIR
jgi:hypothetical protein